MPKRTVSYDPEIRNRIRIAVAAYAYELRDDPILTDAEFDALALRIDPRRLTGRGAVDCFFAREFDPSTGQWIHGHPELAGIAQLYEAYYRNPGRGLI